MATKFNDFDINFSIFDASNIYYSLSFVLAEHDLNSIGDNLPIECQQPRKSLALINLGHSINLEMKDIDVFKAVIKDFTTDLDIARDLTKMYQWCITSGSISQYFLITLEEDVAGSLLNVKNVATNLLSYADKGSKFFQFISEVNVALLKVQSDIDNNVHIKIEQANDGEPEINVLPPADIDALLEKLEFYHAEMVGLLKVNISNDMIGECIAAITAEL